MLPDPGRTLGPARFSFRMPRPWSLRGLLLLLVAVGAALVIELGASPTVGVLEVVAGSPGKVVHRLPAAAGDRFAIRFIHSVEKSEVYEYFRIEPDGTLMMEGTLYHSQGVGLPFDEPGTFTVTAEGMRWSNMNRAIPELHMRTVPFTQHELIKANKTIHLSDPRWTGERLIIRVRPGRVE